MMRRLTKIRLINWHYFANETIHVKNNTLITGQNATGKSTIVDALAYVMTAGDQNFNMAANEKSKRDLRGYVKCKLGIDDKEYLREGDVTGHVALEFYDETQDDHFIVGTVIDAFGEILPPKIIFYHKDGRISDDMFLDEEGRILTTSSFKKHHRSERIFKTKKEAKRAFRSLFGSIHENYFKLLPKALAFKPISDVKDFIYNYLLDEKTLDVEPIRESIQAYKDLEATLKVIKEKIGDLKDIKNDYAEITDNLRQKEFYGYFLKFLEAKRMEENIRKNNKKLEKVNLRKDEVRREIREIEEELEMLDDRSKDVYALLQKDESFKDAQIYDKEILNLNRRIDEQTEIDRYYKRRIERLKPIFEELKNEYDADCYKDLNRLSLNAVTEDSVEDISLSLIEIDKKIKQQVQKNLYEIGKLEENKKTVVEDINDVYETLKDLKNNNLKYSPTVKKLQAEIERGVRERYGTDISVHILAELLEITDPSWADTIEDYLGGQRFNLIVEPRYFDEALQVYNKIKDTLNIYGIGLVNTKKLQKFQKNRDRSLASIITSENKDAMHYINMVCGNLIMVDKVEDLEKHPQAITNSGMVYRSFTVRSLRKRTDKPFIGAKAQASQLENWRKKGAEHKTEYQKIQNKIAELKEENQTAQSFNLPELKDMMQSSFKVRQLKAKRKELVEKKRNLPEESANDLREEYERIKEEIRGLNENRRSKHETVGSLNSDEQKLNETLLEQETSLKELNENLAAEANEDPSLESEAEERFARESQSSRSVKTVIDKYQERIEAELRTITNLEDALKQKQMAYTTKYNLSYGFGIDHIQQYIDEMDKLVKSELVEYEGKVREARESAEKLFKEDFIAKLRDYIISAQDEIVRINETLQNIRFGDDTYQFIFPKSEEYGEYYEMVLSEESIRTGEDIFNYDFEMKYQRQLEELFVNLASDDLNSGGAINRFTDYRTYMDYDIKIKNTQGESILYSKVFKEKSGGETQVPFYVATLASFVRVFEQASQTHAKDAIGLIIFDEVFDKMDLTRIKAMMEFIDQLPVQIVLATPPQKMEVLSKFTDTTIVTLREGKAARAYEVVEKY